MKKPAIIAIDQGTHASRALVFDYSGSVLFKSQSDIAIHYINEFRIEQDPVEILQSVRRVFLEALDNMPEGYYPASAGLATQRSSILAMHKNGEPITKVISWQDTRTTAMLAQYRPYENRIKSITGLPLSAHYGATKIRWLLDNEASVVRARNDQDLQFAPLAAFLLRNLLGERRFVVDHANALRTLLLNLRNTQWDQELLELFGIDQEWLPQCVPVSFEYGHIQGIPLRIVTGDQNAAVFSEGPLDQDVALVNLGTGAFIMKPTGYEYVAHEKLLSGLIFSRAESTSPWHEGISFKSMEGDEGGLKEYSLEGTVNGAASAWDWACRQLGNSEYLTVDRILSKRQGIADIPIFLNTVGGLGSPFWRQGVAPYWYPHIDNPEARLVAVLESILFLVFINIKEIEAKKNPINSLIVTGGLAASDELCRLLAEIMQIPVKRPMVSEATARGLACLAGNRPAGWKSSPVTEFYPGKGVNMDFKRRFEKFVQMI